MSGRNLLGGLPAEAKARIRNQAQPKWVAPMLATLTDEVFSRQGWLFEPKWDGERWRSPQSADEIPKQPKAHQCRSRHIEARESLRKRQNQSGELSSAAASFRKFLVCPVRARFLFKHERGRDEASFSDDHFRSLLGCGR